MRSILNEREIQIAGDHFWIMSLIRDEFQCRKFVDENL